MKDVFVFDDIVPKQHQEFLEYYYLRGENKWYFQQDITYSNSDADKKKVNHYGFSSLIYDRSSKTEVGADFYNILPVVYQALEKINKTVDSIFRIRAFLQLPVVAKDSEANNAHIDLPINHLVILYYLTESDGDTLIYNEDCESESYTIKQRVTPKKGRCVVFDGRLYHSSSRPTNNKRCILNVNLITK